MTQRRVLATLIALSVFVSCIPILKGLLSIGTYRPLLRSFSDYNLKALPQSCKVLVSALVDSKAHRKNLHKVGATFGSKVHSNNISSYSSKYKNSNGKRSGYNVDKSRELELVIAACRGKKGKRITLTGINHAITTAGRAGRTDEAIEIFNSIPIVFGYRPDIMSYNNIIWCAGNAKKVQLAKDLFKELRKSNLKPNVYTYGSIIHGFAKTKDFKQVHTYCSLMLLYLLFLNDL